MNGKVISIVLAEDNQADVLLVRTALEEAGIDFTLQAFTMARKSSNSWTASIRVSTAPRRRNLSFWISISPGTAVMNF